MGWGHPMGLINTENEGIKTETATCQNNAIPLATDPSISNILPEPTLESICETPKVAPITINTAPENQRFELPQTVMTDISKTASDFVGTKIEQEFKKALHTEINRLNVRDLMGTGFDLPADLVAAISNGATTLVQTRVKQELKKALQTELGKVCVQDFLEPLKKAA